MPFAVNAPLVCTGSVRASARALHVCTLCVCTGSFLFAHHIVAYIGIYSGISKSIPCSASLLYRC